MRQPQAKAPKSKTHIRVSIWLPRDLYRQVRITAQTKGFRGATNYIESVLSAKNPLNKAA